MSEKSLSVVLVMIGAFMELIFFEILLTLVILNSYMKLSYLTIVLKGGPPRIDKKSKIKPLVMM